MEILKDKYSITELSEMLQVTDHALRYYEKEFNLTVPKDNRGRRCYSPELANIMYKIKEMRSEGLQIKAIKKILQSDNIIKEPPPVVTDQQMTDEQTMALSRTDTYDSRDIKVFFDEFKNQLASEISADIVTAKEQLSKELNRTKLELGACMENGMRKLEAKMEKHFQDVDRAIGVWREKNKKGKLRKMLKKY